MNCNLVKTKCQRFPSVETGFTQILLTHPTQVLLILKIVLKVHISSGDEKSILCTVFWLIVGNVHTLLDAIHVDLVKVTKATSPQDLENIGLLFFCGYISSTLRIGFNLSLMIELRQYHRDTVKPPGKRTLVRKIEGSMKSRLIYERKASRNTMALLYSSLAFI